MATDDARFAASAALRDLIHAFAAHDADDGALHALAAIARVQTTEMEAEPRRDRMALMHAAIGERGLPGMASGSGFEDRAVGGRANPTGGGLSVHFDSPAGGGGVTP